MLYTDLIPTKAFLSKPTYVQKTAPVGTDSYSINYLMPVELSTLTNSYLISKFDASTPIVDTTAEYSNAVQYSKGKRVQVNAYGMIFEAGADVPAGNHPLDPLSTDSSGVPYWVEADTIDELKPFDASAGTMLSVAGKCLKVRVPVYRITGIDTGNPVTEYYHENISLMGIRIEAGHTNVAAELMAYVQFVQKEVYDVAGSDCTIFADSVLGSFEVDMTRRDRLSFSTYIASLRTEYAPLSDPPSPSVIFTTQTVYAEIFLEARVTGSTVIGGTCGTTNRQLVGEIKLGLVTVGTKDEIGITKLGLKVGRTTTRKNETNYLQRRTVLSAFESFSCSAIVHTLEEELIADYFFRIASETSHIIHAGSPERDWKFVFGVLDGLTPIDSPTTNVMEIKGAGVAFAATDPLITQQRVVGWK